MIPSFSGRTRSAHPDVASSSHQKPDLSRILIGSKRNRRALASGSCAAGETVAVQADLAREVDAGQSRPSGRDRRASPIRDRSRPIAPGRRAWRVRRAGGGDPSPPMKWSMTTASATSAIRAKNRRTRRSAAMGAIATTTFAQGRNAPAASNCRSIGLAGAEARQGIASVSIEIDLVQQIASRGERYERSIAASATRGEWVRRSGRRGPVRASPLEVDRVTPCRASREERFRKARTGK